MSHQGTIQSHPSFGMVSLSRVTSSHGKLLFGSTIKPQSWIVLRVARGDKQHSLGKDWYHANESLIEVNLSPAQFAELITTFNCGSGVPCTISRFDDKNVECFSEEDDTKESRQIIEKLRQYGSSITKPIDTFLQRLEGMVADKKISRKNADELKSHMRGLSQNLESNIPFYVEQLDKSIDKVVVQKKAEMDAFATTMIHNLGMEKLEEIKKLGDTNGLAQITGNH